MEILNARSLARLLKKHNSLRLIVHARLSNGKLCREYNRTRKCKMIDTVYRCFDTDRFYRSCWACDKETRRTPTGMFTAMMTHDSNYQLVVVQVLHGRKLLWRHNELPLS